MSGLTPEDILKFQSPLPLEYHEFREAGKNKKGDKVQWLVYMDQQGLIPLLNEIDPNWTWEIQRIDIQQGFVWAVGRLTIKGITREGAGGNSPNGKNSPISEDTVKGAETDALKRAALRFGVGLYLRSVPMFWVDFNEATYKPWEAEKEVEKQFAAWYNRTYGKKSPTPPQSKVTTFPAASPAEQSGETVATDKQPMTDEQRKNLVTRALDFGVQRAEIAIALQQVVSYPVNNGGDWLEGYENAIAAVIAWKAEYDMKNVKDVAPNVPKGSPLWNAVNRYVAYKQTKESA